VPTIETATPFSAWRWFAWAVASFPVAVLSHESAHYAAYRVFGFSAPQLHFGSASSPAVELFWQRMREGGLASAALVLPPEEVGIAALAGLIATYVVILACVLLAKRRPHPFWFGLGLVAPLRFLGSLFVVVRLVFGVTGRNGSDEAHVAGTLPLSELLLHLTGIAVLIISWVALIRLIPRDIPRIRITVIAGIVAGGALYIGALGPILLP
jgi:hypothetical protein